MWERTGGVHDRNWLSCSLWYFPQHTFHLHKHKMQIKNVALSDYCLFAHKHSWAHNEARELRKPLTLTVLGFSNPAYFCICFTVIMGTIKDQRSKFVRKWQNNVDHNVTRSGSAGARWNNPYFVPSGALRLPGRFIFGESVTSQASILISIHYETVTNIPNFFIPSLQ